jgi:hypothetical protein
MKLSEEEEVSAVSMGGSGAKRPLVIVLAVIGVVALIIGVLLLVAPHSLGFIGTFMGHKHGNHPIRGAVALVVGVGALVGAWFMNKKSS